ncbi:UNVERIFIED_CONTAM: hypothetical protein RKD50_002095 [Streptomyces canus]
MKSRTGRTSPLTRFERAAQMPTGTAITSAMIVATRTSERVVIASSHSSRESMKANPAKVRRPARVPRSQKAITAKMPASRRGWGAWRTASIPS